MAVLCFFGESRVSPKGSLYSLIVYMWVVDIISEFAKCMCKKLLLDANKGARL